MSRANIATPIIEQAFRRFAKELQPGPTEIQTARRHFLQVRARLNRSFVVARTVMIGSHVKGTAVRGISDVDVMPVLRRREALWGGSRVSSETFLSNVRDDLTGRYPNTRIRRDGQAAVIEFARGERSVDVVPAIYAGPSHTGHPIFHIPDGHGGWLSTSPERHAALFRDSDTISNGRLARIVRMLKFWAKARAVPLPAHFFHVEMLFVTTRFERFVRPYSRAITLALTYLRKRDGGSLRDPAGIAGLIPLARTDSQRDTVLRSLDHAGEHATAALLAEAEGDAREATRQWRILFGTDFARS